MPMGPGSFFISHLSFSISLQQSFNCCRDVFPHGRVQPEGSLLVSIHDEGVATFTTNGVKHFCQTYTDGSHCFLLGLAQLFG